MIAADDAGISDAGLGTSSDLESLGKTRTLFFRC